MSNLSYIVLKVVDCSMGYLEPVDRA